MGVVKQNSNDNQFLTFYISDKIYGMAVLHIKEILEYSRITHVPLMQECVRGVTNVRGNVVPIIDLGMRLGAREVSDVNKRTSVIVIEKEDEIQNFDVGLIVDEVDKVYEILQDDLENAPDFGSKIRSDFIEKMGKINGQFVTILDPFMVINIDELSQVHDERGSAC
jgi:purine-binding chemotaxis protein CheW